MTENWLITGGAGFIGSNFVRLAHEKTSANLVILDLLTYAGNLANLEDLLSSPRVKFIKGDICDSNLVRDTFVQHNILKVVHFAAESHVDRSILGAAPFIKTNIEGTFNLLETAKHAWAKKTDALFLHVSTDEVFGSLDLTSPPFNEKSPYKPNSPYSASKAASDHLVRAWHKTYGLPTIITNCSNNYGPWQFPEKLIPLMILNALEGKELPIYGDGLYVRDWIHIIDHCEALLAILEKGRIGETYTISGNNERSNIEIVHKICDVIDSLLQRPNGSSRRLIRCVSDRPGHDRRYALDSSKIRMELNWEPNNSIDEALVDVVKWYYENKKWVRNVRSGDYLSYYEQQYGVKI